MNNNKTHVFKEQHKEEAVSRWWDREATGTGSAFTIRRKLLTTTTFSAPHMPTSTRSVVPRQHHRQHGDLTLLLSQTVPLRVCWKKKWNFKVKKTQQIPPEVWV